MPLQDKYSPIIGKVNYNSFSVKAIKELDFSEKDEQLILDYPTVYIIDDKISDKKHNYNVYVGETTDINRRTKQHLNDDIRNGREDFKKLSDSSTTEMYIIGHKYFNKSLTLDIENRLLHYLLSSESVKNVNNRRGNPQNDYYTSEIMDSVFSKIWRKLHSLNNVLFPIESVIRDSALFKASPFHKLTKEQKEAKSKIILQILSSLTQNLDGQLILVEGEAGSGKTVLMSSLLYDLFNSNEFPVSKDKMSIHLLVNHEQQLTVYQQMAKKLGLKNKNGIDVVIKPTSFINYQSKNNLKADVVIVDEAHLLLTQGKQSYRGKNHLKDLLANAKVVVAVFDENQILTTEQIWESADLAEMKLDAQCVISLRDQMRINAQQSTIDWIRSLVDEQVIYPFRKDDKYDFRVFDSPQEMYDAIKEKDQHQENGISRMLATYDWKFKQKGKPEDNQYWNVTIGDFSMPWNLQLPKDKATKNLSWAEQKQTIDEIGSTYTIQGFDLNYAAVIIGPSVKYRDGKIIFDPSASCNEKAIRNRTLADGTRMKFGETLLKNELNVLLTRGVNGLYLFAVDEELQKALKEAIEKIE
ncbi:DUF2075 domain-containing protein [Streptococcus gallolyticus]|uniref:GIY-YIG domain-containing protein n=2 Tax=Streptococcus gallolyticus TaxID=315405 RepID=A0AA36JXN9_STRG3|nr:DUF2075 domain-containing protein [Streptococcus gallolyticus]EFM29685.1 GIY-YIG catalytic domain protein [Streptococcus gallolyticus subsp. gallolyticus TX20005]QKI01749.1 DUF2075 domain-containing protein [Streptococcus gallolyticus]QWX87817.1 DUF2075 domain-containing protein [Streptococcus gallolyticus subsp. gallolyticus TX20005]CBI13554.1 conserved hypothetical protein [Streptococcus gallolyticus UCN34]CBZ48220.1 conserved hypothetical protein [Streptococcus gallolyticus subsp. gallol